MAKCNYCKKEMPKAKSCEWNGKNGVKFPDGKIIKAIPYDNDDGLVRCHDCGVKVRGYHHPGCDMERCPKCKGQLISCGCLDDSSES